MTTLNMKIKIPEKQFILKYPYALMLGYRPKFIDSFKILYEVASEEEWDVRCTIETKIDNICNPLPFPLDSVFLGILNMYFLIQSIVWLIVFCSILILTPILYIILFIRARDNRIHFTNLSEEKQNRVRDIFYNG